MLAVVQIPQHGLAVLAAAGAQTAVGRNRHGVEVTGVAGVVDLQTAVGQVPDLDHAVPTRRHYDRVRVVRGETHARHLSWNSRVKIWKLKGLKIVFRNLNFD